MNAVVPMTKQVHSTSLEGVDNVESAGIADTRHSCVTSIEKEATPLSLPIGRKKSSRVNS